MKVKIALLFILALPVFSQTPAPKPPEQKTGAFPVPPAAPVVSDTVKLRFFKAEFEFQAASDQATQAAQAARDKQAALQVIVKELETTCGDKFQPSMSQSRDPECVPKVETKGANQPPVKP